MGRGKNEQCWEHAKEVKNEKRWICKYCKNNFAGGATKIEAHLGLNGKGGGIRRCSNYPPVAGNEGSQNNNNMASTSSNPPEAMINRIYSTQYRDNGAAMNWNGCNSSFFEMEQFLDLECDDIDIQKQLQWSESRGKKRKPEVDVWLNNLNDIDMINELTKDVNRHKEEEPLSLSTEFVGEALDLNIKEVFKLLEDDKVFVIGLYGMGGVGKTLLATLIENKVKRKGTFKDVLWVSVSNNYSILKMQEDIAKNIGLKLDEEDERNRADKLSSALEKEKIVLILDDVWKYIDLKKVGIHSNLNGVKVILTTRLEHVCHQMDCLPHHMIQMKPLCTDGEDSWELFEVKLGDNGIPAIFSPEIEKTARHIVDRCDGLPLGISVMARIMKGLDSIHQWKYAFNKLKKLEMGQEVEEEVFKVLKRSYDNLEKDLQNYFLYCALLSSDCIIEKDELIMKLVDKGLINGNMCLEEIFDEGNAILDKLKAHSLLNYYDYSVGTHRLVIDMACYIMKESKRNAMVTFEKELTKVSSTEEWAANLELVHIRGLQIVEIQESMAPHCPVLSTLIINELSVSHIPDLFFKYMNILSIVDLSYNENLESLPNSITKLRSLVSLILNQCSSLKHVPPLGELQKLSRLVISNTSIDELQGLEKLINLKWFDLSHNKSLKLELGSFSSNLTKIQYLDLRHTPALIMVEDVQGMNMLECFGGLLDCKHYNNYVQKEHDISFGLKTYHLTLRNICDESRVIWQDDVNLKIFVPGDPETRIIQFEDCDNFSHILPKDLTCLKIYENNNWVCVCDALSYSGSSSLKKIDIFLCKQLRSVFCLSGSCSFCTKTHKLEDLELQCLESLTVVCKDVDVRQSLSLGGIFSCLKNINIYKCNLIEKLLSLMLVQQLQYLETITVSYCDSMKEIFVVSHNEDNDGSFISLPKLTRLKLCYLPELKIVCKGSILCGSSPEVVIYYCPNLERRPTIQIRNQSC